MLIGTLLCIPGVHLALQRYLVKFYDEYHQSLVRPETPEVLNLDWLEEILSKKDGNSFVESEPSKVIHQYNFDGLLGVALQSTPEAMKEIIANPRVEYWTFDHPIALSAPTNPEVTWGLDRIDQRKLPLNNKFKKLKQQGEGITVFVIDSGIDARHPEFEGRAKVGPSFVRGEFKELDTDNSDTQGHGTHCAGTIAGKTFGVATKANITGLKAYDDDGGESGVIAAVQYAIRHAIAGKTVINMSLATDPSKCVEKDPLPDQEVCNSPLMKAAVRAAVKRNIPVIVAAGNYAIDACEVAPASEPLAYTVGASTDADRMAHYSNFGPCVDIFAPGSSILSAHRDLGTKSLSGTSMAAPFVTGAFAVLLSAQKYDNVHDLYQKMTDLSTKGELKFLPNGTENRLLYVE